MRIFSVILPVRISGLLFSEFVLTFLCYLAAVLATFRSDTHIFLFTDDGFLRLFLVSLSVLLGLFVNNLYADTRVRSRVLLVLQLCNIVGIAFIVQGLLAYISSGFSLPRSVMIAGSILLFLTLLLWRMFYGGVLLKMIGTRNILFIGDDPSMGEIAARIRVHPELGFGISGYLSDSGDIRSQSGSDLGEYLGKIHDLEEVAARFKPDRIVIGRLERGQSLPIPSLLNLARRGILIEEVATTYERVCGRVCSGALKPSQIIFHNEMGSRPGSVALQSIYTNLIALSAIIITAPVLLLASLAVKITSRGSLFAVDVRVGQHGIPFNLNRFRCHRSSNFANESSAESLTPVGKLLIKLHLAHLPQVFNLLRGEITLVGPRPERPEFVEELAQYFAYYQQRHSVKPGVTGWSQINTVVTAKRTDSLTQLEYDLYYTKHISLALDAYILLHGIRRILPFARS